MLPTMCSSVISPSFKGMRYSPLSDFIAAIWSAPTMPFVAGIAGTWMVM